MPRLRRYSRSSIESLENRIVPAVTIQAGVDLDADGNADDVKIVGGNESTKVFITDEGMGAGSLAISVDINGDGDFTDGGEVSAQVVNVTDDSCIIDLKLGGGNDVVTYQLGGNLALSNRHLSIDLGSGNDVFLFNGNGHSATAGTMLMIDFLAGAGNDQLMMVVPDMSNSEIVIDAIMGAGNDVVSQQTAGGILSIESNSFLDVNVDLGAGANTASIMLAATIGTGTKSNVSYDIIGGSGVDKVNVMNAIELGNGVQNSNLNVNAELGGGNDEFSFISVQLDIETDSSQFVHASGGSGNDKIVVGYVEDTASTIKGLAQYDLLGGLGNDQIVSFLVGNIATGIITLTGQLKLNMMGQEGNDQMYAALLTTAASTGNYSLIQTGGAGNDEMAVGLETNGATMTYGKFGKLIVDGGQGTDSLENYVTPASLVDARFFETIV
jgi:hypothetical protein